MRRADAVLALVVRQYNGSVSTGDARRAVSSSTVMLSIGATSASEASEAMTRLEDAVYTAGMVAALLDQGFVCSGFELLEATVCIPTSETLHPTASPRSQPDCHISSPQIAEPNCPGPQPLYSQTPERYTC